MEVDGQMAETLTGKSTARTAYGEELPKPITFQFEYQKFASLDEAKTAQAYPDDKKLLNMINSEQLNNARQKALVSTLDAAGYKRPTLENSVELRIATIVKALKASGNHTDESARTAAMAMLGVTEEPVEA
jgi:hypothetical protein